MTQLAGKTVLVTGGASGMGRRIAYESARRGSTIVLWDIDAENLDLALGQLRGSGAQCHGYVCNVADHTAVYETATRVRDEVGDVDVVVNSAGVVSGRPILELADEEIERTFAVNTLALYWTCKAFLPRMVERNSGHIVTLASASGLIGVARLSDYAASKWAAIGFDESLRMELRQTAPAVRTTVVCPYYVNTGMFTGVRSRFPWLLPILDEAMVAERIVWAIERDRRRLFMPWPIYLLPAMRLLPTALFDALADFLGVNVSMKEFVGRARRASGAA